ncbi:MAG: hypothetical protein ACYC3I_02020 [Gemmataceae bacterium]
MKIEKIRKIGKLILMAAAIDRYIREQVGGDCYRVELLRIAPMFILSSKANSKGLGPRAVISPLCDLKTSLDHPALAMLGLALLAAVALKGHELAAEELLEDSLLTSRWFLMLAWNGKPFSPFGYLAGSISPIHGRPTGWPCCTSSPCLSWRWIAF